MYLEENVIRLNEIYEDFPISFVMDEDIINVVEDEAYYLNNNPQLKAYLKEKFKMSFNNTFKWHIGMDGVKILENKPFKTKPSKEIDDLKSILGRDIENIEEEDLKNSIENFFSNNPTFFTFPAALYYHHDYSGGLLEHSIQTLRIALSILETITEISTISKDLIIVGSILHDIGKINCYEEGEGCFYATSILSEQDHIINGVKIVSQNIVSERLDDLIHIIASHHNQKEWGSPVEPNTFEAWIVHSSEFLSSRILG